MSHLEKGQRIVHVSKPVNRWAVHYDSGKSTVDTPVADAYPVCYQVLTTLPHPRERGVRFLVTMELDDEGENALDNSNCVAVVDAADEEDAKKQAWPKVVRAWSADLSNLQKPFALGSAE